MSAFLDSGKRVLSIIEVDYQRLEAILLTNGTRFDKAEERIREYCDIEVYEGYDDRHNVDNRITMKDIGAANELYAMIDRYDPTENSRIVGAANVESALSAVKDSELVTMNNEQWSEVRPRLRVLLAGFLSVRGVGLAKATKILHLKRPHLFPVLDSFVLKFLSGKDPAGLVGKPKSIELGLEVMDIARSDVMANAESFAELLCNLANLPIPLTSARMYDILCWTQERWVVRGNTHAKYGIARKSV